MDKEMINKRGAISLEFLVIIILLIVGFIIALIFYYNLGGTKTLDDTVCHSSVIFRATLPSLFQGYVPLKCQTKKICITAGIAGGLKNAVARGDCKAFEGEKGIQTVKVAKGAKGEDEIAKLYTEEIYNCWKMMGEGKVSLWHQFSAEKFGFGSVYPSCVICSRIAFDYDKLKDIDVEPDDVEIQEYMMTHKPKNSNLTYFEIIVGEGGKYSTNELDENNIKSGEITTEDVESLASSSGLTIKDEDTQEIVNELKSAKKGFTKETTFDRLIDYSKDSTSVLFMQITAPSHGNTFSNFMTGVAGILGLSFLYKSGSFFSMPSITKIPGSIKVELSSIVTSEGAMTGTVTKIPTRYKFASGIKGGALKSFGTAAGYAAIAAGIVEGLLQTNVAWQRSMTAGKCSDIEIGTDARNGCSAVRAVPYEPEMISTYCAVIDSIP